MKKIEITAKNRLVIENISGFLKKKVTKFGDGAKVDCPKRYLGKEVYLVITKGRKKV
jgi:putative transposon-encoded protein